MVEKKQVNTRREQREWIFYITSLLMFLICCFAIMGGDDIGSMRVQNGTIAECWEKTIQYYRTWSSRVLVNLVIFILTSKPPVIWAAYMGSSLFVLQKAFAMLFLDKDKEKEYDILISALVLTYSLSEMSTAGWIATSCTYFGPIAFGFMSLVPIKKVLRKEKIKYWEYMAYIICLLYGANNEQMGVVILSSYLVMLVYCLFNKYNSKFLVVMALLSIESLIFTLTCPGNHNRAWVELIKHNPTYGMLNFLNKLDLGITKAAWYLLFGNRILIIVICFMFSVLMFEKSKDLTYRFVSCVPTAIIVLLGVLKDIVIKVYPSLEVLTREIPRNGLVNAENMGEGGGYVICQYFVMGITILMIGIEFILLQSKLEGIVVTYALLVAGFASAVAIGFSPTVFISGNRVYAVMDYCLIAAFLYTIVNATNIVEGSDNKSILICEKAKLLYGSIIGISLMNLWCSTMTVV